MSRQANASGNEANANDEEIILKG
ncbi:hypothetical protein ELI_4158 [Eubacterium callanderi]|uniref:Uncharacterized protein n=1 Tax=Eubacterium callanderi TaxID=53442 RepID=E3GQ51_9FIRM|nr:hypothetical protein ELI_4158 [Eubacterium callanderi]